MIEVNVKQIIGVDCAVQPSRLGLALARKNGSKWELAEVCAGSSRLKPADLVAEWYGKRQGPMLLALDAPLGWPAELAKALPAHFAGALLGQEANQLFRRDTDRFVRQVTGKQPLDVGAGWIARTAHWALQFLAEVRRLTKLKVPLVWDGDILEMGAVEVYPAATLLGHGVAITGYKNTANASRREEVLAKLGEFFELGNFRERLLAGADTLDAGICVLAGLDFLRGSALPPVDLEIAKKEGWIWFRNPQA